jgi:predicted dienelactone hydrolase
MFARRHLPVLLLFILAALTPPSAHAATAQPDLGAAGPFAVVVTREVWRDGSRNRDIPVKIYSPEHAVGPLPVVIFSHGLGGSVEAGETWGRQWASWGIASVHVQHAGSDTAALRSGQMASAMSLAQLIARCKDVSFAASEIARRAARGDPPFAHVDATRIGLAGHSFGAQTVEAVSGQTYPIPMPPLADSRFRAFIAFSPSARDTTNVDREFSGITTPFLSITGSQDQIAITPEITPQNRTLPFQHMAPGDKYLLWLDTAAHMSFAGQEIPRPRSALFAAALGEGVVAPNQTHIDYVVKAVTTAFLIAYLQPDTPAGQRALRWLKSNAPSDLLNPGDRFQKR